MRGRLVSSRQAGASSRAHARSSSEAARACSRSFVSGFLRLRCDQLAARIFPHSYRRFMVGGIRVHLPIQSELAPADDALASSSGGATTPSERPAIPSHDRAHGPLAVLPQHPASIHRLMNECPTTPSIAPAVDQDHPRAWVGTGPIISRGKKEEGPIISRMPSAPPPLTASKRGRGACSIEATALYA